LNAVSESRMTETVAYQKGVEAYKAGKKLDDCPYSRVQPFGDDRYRWMMGYLDAKYSAKYSDWKKG